MSQLPLFLFVFPVGMALVGLMFARWPRVVAGLGLFTAAFLWWYLANATVDLAFTIADYSFILTPVILDVARLLYGITAVLFALTWVWPPHAHFVPATLLALSLLIPALMVPNLLFGATFLCLGLAILAIVMQAGRPQATPVALRYLLFTMLSLPLFLLLEWLLPFGQTQRAVQLFVVIALLLLAGFPFFMWVNRLVVDAPLATVVFVVGVGQTAVLAFLFQFLAANEWLVSDLAFRQLLRWGGVATVLVAGVIGLQARKPRPLLGAFLLLDMGFAVLTLTFPVGIGWETAVMLLLVRVISLFLAMLGLQFLETREAQSPFSLLLFAYGSLSLLGLPLTIGFGGRWVMITAVAQQTSTAVALLIPWLALFLLLALAANTYALFRFLIYWLTAFSSQGSAAEPLWLRIGIALLFLATAVLAAFPQPLLTYAHLLAAPLQ